MVTEWYEECRSGKSAEGAAKGVTLTNDPRRQNFLVLAGVLASSVVDGEHRLYLDATWKRGDSADNIEDERLEMALGQAYGDMQEVNDEQHDWPHTC
ncbi:hypothetical protein H6P81_005934 [Aristolochia fimbriata]|uniref:Uncharacterized protein n=1 Tax=Aristolochia fimbriata TaxID=158543 RepID=A0AAV7EVV4_ARIFI|nr:hypothetical protein H6P81_005934 [Aristolochia fimbriata]